MKTVRDLLVWYNNLDVDPFLEAAEKMFEFWKGMGIDMFKGGAISLPGLAYIHIKIQIPKHTVVPLWNRFTKDWHKLVKNNIVGGPSIVFHMYYEQGVTKIRGGDDVDTIFGFDANDLYLWCIMQNMPTGHYAKWKPTEDRKFKRHLQKGRKEGVWLEWMARDTKVEHAYNGGQKRVGKYLVDGWVPEKNQVLQSHGCYFYGHGCGIDRNQNPEDRTKRRERTERVSQTIRDAGLDLVEKWECEFDTELRENDEMREFMEEHFNLPKKKSTQTQAQMFKQILCGRRFGLREVDIEIPEEKRRYFEEMTPIFKNTDISREDIGDYMRECCEFNDVMKEPRRALVGSYFGKKILLATPLIRWYLNKGLKLLRFTRVLSLNLSPV